jgi:HlyD family secretion protein
MKRFLAIVLVLIIIGGSWLIYDRTKKPVASTGTPQGVKTMTIQRDAIEATIAATGSISAERVQPLNFNTSGKVVEVFVKEGDTVTAGQPLAHFDTKDLELNLKQAEAALLVSEASLARARKPATEEEIAAAKAAIASAKASLADLSLGPTQHERELAQLQVDQAKNSLWGAQGSRDAIVGNSFSSPGSKDTAQAQVSNAELSVRVAEINRDKLSEGPKEAQIRAAASQIAQGESTLAKLLAMPAPEDIAVQEAQVNQARVGVEIAKARLDDATLKAPFVGKLVAWNLHVGDTVMPTTAAGTLVDVSRYHVDVSIDETEISQVVAGQKVHLTLDAFSDQQFGGNVATVDVLGTNTQGIVNYGVRIDLDHTELPIKPLMTASISIVVQRKENVLMVPNRALKRDKQGKYVEVLQGATLTRAYVTTGASNEDNTEIIKGLEEGQEVVVSKPRENIMGASMGG